MIRYKIEQDDVGASTQLAGCFTVTDVRKRLEQLFPGEEWCVFEGGKHVRLHRYPRKGWLSKILGKGEPKSVFFAIEI